MERLVGSHPLQVLKDSHAILEVGIQLDDHDVDR